MKFALYPVGGTLSKGIHHFGFALTGDEKPAIYEKLAAGGRVKAEH
jgi:hypothetical protein